VAGDAVVCVNQPASKHACIGAVARQQRSLCSALVVGVVGRENRHADESHQHDDRKTPCRAIPASGQSHRGHHLLTSMMSFMSGCTAHSTSTVPALSKTMLFDPPCPYDPRSKLLTSDSENT